MIESFQARSKSTIIEEHFFFGKRFLQNTKMKMKKPRYPKGKIIRCLIKIHIWLSLSFILSAGVYKKRKN